MPVAVTDVVLTLESVQSITIFPVYVALIVSDLEELEAGDVVFLTTGFVVVQPVGHLGVAALTIFEAVPL